MADMAAQASGERWLVAARLSRMSKRDRARPGAITGIKTQDEESTAWAGREGHTIVKVTKDRAVSGSIAPWDRPDLGPWLTDPALMAQYDGIVGFDATRVSRDYADLPNLRKWAEKNGKKLHVIKERLSWPDNRDGVLWAVAAERGYQERQDTIERTTRELNALRAAGKLTSRPPWGYRSAGQKYDHHLVLTAAGEQYLAEFFTRVADDEPVNQAGAWLSGVTGHAFHGRTLCAMVRCTTYRGQVTDSAGRVIHTCPPAVDGETWRRANAALDRRTPVRQGQRTDLATGAAVLSGLAYCGNPACDATGRDLGPSPMYRVMSGYAASRRPVYRCSGRGAQRRGCGNNVSQASADALIDQAMAGNLAQVMRPVFHPATGHQVALDDVQQQLDGLPARRLPRAEFRAESDRLYDEIERLTALPRTDAWTEYVPVCDVAGQPLTYGSQWAASDQSQRRTWLRKSGFQIELCTPDTDLPDPSQPGDSLARMDTYEDDSALLIFRWTGDDDDGLGRGLPSVEMAD